MFWKTNKVFPLSMCSRWCCENSCFILNVSLHLSISETTCLVAVVILPDKALSSATLALATHAQRLVFKLSKRRL